jgi:peptide/nickel transport system substrate-binding protein
LRASSYWSRFLQRRLQRRRVLKGLGTVAAAAAGLGLLGCRDEDGAAETDDQDKSGLLSRPEDTSETAVAGGTLPAYFSADVSSFDGMTSLAGQTSFHNDFAYARLVNFHVFNAAQGERIDNTLDPYAAESWDVSGDGTEYVFHLQPNGKLDPRPPTNGRVLDAQDVVASWERFKATHRARGLLSNQVNPNAPVESMEALDAMTVRMKLAYPSVSLLAALAFSFYFMLQPVEADGGFDPRQTMRGSGPWMLSEYETGTAFAYRKNPGFHRKDRPFMDGIDGRIIQDYAQGLAQLTAGHLYSYNVRQEDVIATKEQAPALDLMSQDGFPRAASAIVFFSFKPGSIFRDDRVRRAMSLLIDRDLYIDTQFNAAQFEALGLPVQRRWATVLPVGEDELWLDPRSDDFGPSARYFRYDPEEARKLVQAAAGELPVKERFTTIVGNEYGADHHQDADVLQGMWSANGDFELERNVVDYGTVFLPKYSISGPERTFDGGGVALAGVAPFPEPDILLGEWYMKGGTYYKFEPDYPDNATWESLMASQRTERDAGKRLSVLQDIQRYHAEKMYTIHRPGFSLGFALKQPWLANAGAFVSASTNTFAGNIGPSTSALHWWLDEAKR